MEVNRGPGSPHNNTGGGTGDGTKREGGGIGVVLGELAIDHHLGDLNNKLCCPNTVSAPVRFEMGK